jgi:hypothetical protein
MHPAQARRGKSVDLALYDPLDLQRVVRGSVHHDRGRGV